MPDSDCEERVPGRFFFVSPDADALARDAALRIVRISREAVSARGAFHLALSGGGTPRATYRRLASPELSGQVDWSRAHVWWSDERAVPADSPDSNTRMAQEALIAHVPIPPYHVHRVRTELGAEEAAARYEAEILGRMKDEGGRMKDKNLPPSSFILPPSFDLILLGLGDDGHTASLFPGTLDGLPPDRLVAALPAPKAPARRITFTPRLINAARRVLFLVSGRGKASTLHRVLHGPHQPDALPAQAVAPADGELIWMADADAANYTATQGVSS